MTAVIEYDEGVAYDTYLRTFNGFSGATKPTLKVEIGFGGFYYEELIDAAYDKSVTFDTDSIYYTGIAATGQTITYESEIGYGGEITSALDPTPDEWTDVSAYVRQVNVRRGNDNFLIRQVEAGSATIVLDDPDSRFLPSNTASFYYPFVKPARPVRVMAVWSDAETEIFRGMTERWTQNFGRNLATTEVILTCVDTTALLERYDVDQTLIGSSGDTTDERISDLLDDTGPFSTRQAWPTLLRDIDTTTTATIEQDAAGTTTLLSALRKVVDSEWGLLYASKDGKLTFKGRSAANPGSSGVVEPKWAFGDADTFTVLSDTYAAGRYDTIEVESDDGTLTNLVIVTDAFGNDGGWKYPDAIQEFEERRLNITTLLQDSADAEVLASFVLNNQYDPLLRIKRLGFYLGAGNTASTSTAVNAELLDTVIIKQTTPGNVEMILRGVVFGIEYEITREQFYTTFIFGPQFSDSILDVKGEAV